MRKGRFTLLVLAVVAMALNFGCTGDQGPVGPEGPIGDDGDDAAVEPLAQFARGFIRAWHAHKKEAKYVMVVSGAALVGAVQIDDWDNPSRDAQVHRHVLSARAPSVLFIPAGYANGFMSLAEDTKILFFSTRTLEESLGDDIRYDARYWNPWTVEER